MDQIIGIVDSYGYWPMVRQVFSHGVFRRRTGQPFDASEIERGLAASTKVLAALQQLIGPLVADDDVSRGDLHLGAMTAYFVLAPEGATVLRQYPRLAAWWARLSARPSFAVTDPGLPSEGDRR